LEPITQTKRLHEKIYDKIIIKAQEYTPEKADEYKDSHALLGEVYLAHEEFKKDPRHSEWDDMFGAYLMETEQLYNRAGQFFTPMNVVRAMCEVTIGVMSDEEMLAKPQMMNDPAAGCGRFMIGAAEIYAKRVGCFNFLFVNQDIDFRMYVYTTMNAILYGIPSLNVHCNTISLEYWEGTIVMRPAECPTFWRTIPKERLDEIMPQMKAPKRGLEKFVDGLEPAKKRKKRKIPQEKPQQRSLFDLRES